MPTLSARARTLQESAIRKLDITVAQHTDTVFHRLNIGQPDVATPAAVLQAFADFQPEVVAYGPASGLPACRQAAARYHSRWNSRLNAQDVAVTTGGSEALLFAFTALCDPGDEIIVLEPYYTNYNGFATVAGARITPIRTELSDGFALPSDAVLDAAVTPRTKALVFSNPANPTGAVYSRAEVERLAAWAQRHDIFLISDEVYRRIWFDEPPASALELSEELQQHVIVVDSMSKTFSACGLRLGFLISRNKGLMEKVERLGQARLGPQPLAQHAAIAALNLPDDYYEQVRLAYAGRVSTLIDALSILPGVQVPRPQGAFYAMLRLPVDSSERFARWLVEEFREDGQSVVVAPGPGFYADPSSGTNEIRLAAVLNEDRIRRASRLLASALDAYPGRVDVS
ncbi:MAG: pyridoxal phosphate-dependent aminotransferase [Myxococcota bacterium]